MALVLSERVGPVDVGKLLKMCIVHDLGEAISGDVPAIHQNPAAPKSDAERRDLLLLVQPLPADIRAEIVALWDEYERAESAEAKIAKALDKLETIMQHNQGKNPADFDYRFNLTYGLEYTGENEVVAAVRAVLDAETEARARQREV
jgi:putative hydrolase of HD superfamily